ncbi:hypothetical protein ACFWPX_02830 [Nocardia sp. NPDC058518]|uniref:hypothetical protein n=1 Tax=Nocardia sp. NPDC058518 TaxID=3346534 RepID=UPI00364CA48D
MRPSKSRRKFGVFSKRPCTYRTAVWDADHVEASMEVDVDGRLMKSWATRCVDTAHCVIMGGRHPEETEPAQVSARRCSRRCRFASQAMSTVAVVRFRSNDEGIAGMAGFPNGDFTITNNDTGRCLRARLGKSTDLSHYKEGTKYLLQRTAPPELELGDADGSMACAWYLETSYDRSDAGPRNQIVNVAVRDLQNIGNHCVGARANGSYAGDALTRRVAFARAIRERRLAATMPAAWTGNEQEWQGLVKDTMKVIGDSLVFGNDEEQAAFARKLEQQVRDTWDPCPPSAWVGDMQVLFDSIRAYDKKWQTDSEPVPDEDPQPGGESSAMEMRGCGQDQGEGITQRWSTDGTHIWSTSDRKYLPAVVSYWTDRDGVLIGRDKSDGYAQRWTIQPWAPPPARSRTVDATGLLSTGLFGPLSSIFSN